MPILTRGDNFYPAPDGTKSGLIPTEYSTDIIQAARESSLALSTFRSVTMPAGVQHMPVLDVLPIAKWVTGEPGGAGTGGEKATAEQKWKGLVLTAEEIAAIVVIPEAVLEDSSIDLWAEITPRLGESIGAAIDAATFAGTDKPASWPAAIGPAALAAGNRVGTNGAAASDANYNTVIGMVEASGFMPDTVYASVAQRTVFRAFNAGGVPIYLTDIRDDARVDSIHGIPVKYDRMGVLGAATHAIVGDPTMAILGTRVDLQYKVLTEATIDVSALQDGSAMVSLPQQDSVALRVRGRFGFAVANPVTMLEPVEANRYPFAIIDNNI